MRVESKSTFEAARKALVTTEWVLPGEDQEGGEDVAEMLLSMVVSGGIASLDAPLLPSLVNVFGVTSAAELKDISAVFFGLVVRATSPATPDQPPSSASCCAPAVLEALPPSTDSLWRRPALLAALESLAALVWQCQEAVHASSPSKPPQSSKAAAVVCPLCVAVAMANELATEALSALLAYHVALHTEESNREVEDSPTRTMLRDLHSHRAALVRTAVWNGHASMARCLTGLWSPPSSTAAVLARALCLYVQDEATTAQATTICAVSRTEDDVLASLQALHGLCTHRAHHAALARWSVGVPLLWLRDHAQATETTAPPALTLLAWLVSRRFERAVRVVLGWLVAVLAPPQPVSAVDTARAVAPSTSSSPPVVSTHTAAPPVDFRALAAALVPAPTPSSQPGQPDTEADARDWASYAAVAQAGLLLLHGAALEVDEAVGCVSPSALDVAVRSGQGSLVRLLMVAGASSASVHTAALESLFAQHPIDANSCEEDEQEEQEELDESNNNNNNNSNNSDGALDEGVGLLHLLRDPVGNDDSGDADKPTLLQQLRDCLYTSSKAILLASIAAKLWQQKVALLPAPEESPLLLCDRIGSAWQTHLLAQDRVLRPALAALELDPFEPVARLTLVHVLARKLQEGVPLLRTLWVASDVVTRGQGEEAAASTSTVARQWLAYYGTVWRLLVTLTETTAGRNILTRAVQSRRLMDQYTAAAHMSRVRRRCADWQAPSTSGESEEADGAVSSALFHAITAEARPALASVERAALERFGSTTKESLPHARTTTTTTTTTPAPQVTRDVSGRCFVSVHCSEAFLASEAGGACAFLRPLNSDHGAGLAGAAVRLEVPPLIDLAASLAHAGGTVGVVRHTMPLDAPFEKGDLVLFVCRPVQRDHIGSEGADGSSTRLEAVQRVSCHQRQHSKLVHVPCVLRTARVVTLQLVCAGQPAALASSSACAAAADPMVWLDTRQVAPPGRAGAGLSTAPSPTVPVDVLWGMRMSPTLTERWQRAALVTRSAACWAYNILEDSAEEAVGGPWCTWDHEAGLKRPLPSSEHRLARPLLGPDRAEGAETVPVVYVLEQLDSSEAQASAPRVVAVLPA